MCSYKNWELRAPLQPWEGSPSSFKSWNRLAWKRSLRSSSPTINPALNHVPNGHQDIFKSVPGMVMPPLPWAALDNAFGEEIFHNTPSKPLLAQRKAVSSCSVTWYVGEESDLHLSTASLPPSPQHAASFSALFIQQRHFWSPGSLSGGFNLLNEAEHEAWTRKSMGLELCFLNLSIHCHRPSWQDTSSDGNFIAPIRKILDNAKILLEFLLWNNACGLFWRLHTLHMDIFYCNFSFGFISFSPCGLIFHTSQFLDFAWVHKNGD